MELLKDKNLFFEKEGENIKQFYNMYQKKTKGISKYTYKYFSKFYRSIRNTKSYSKYR